jgi:HEAT repeat protein
MSNDSVLDFWTEMATDKDPRKRACAVDAIAAHLNDHIVSRGLSEPLVLAVTAVAVHDPEGILQRFAVEGRAFKCLVWALWDSERIVRQTAAEGLREMGEPVFAVFTDPLAKGYFEEIQEWAADGLGRLGDRRGVAALLLGLKSVYATVRCRSAEALGEIRDAPAIEGLTEASENDPEEEVRQQARAALGKIQAPS